MASYLVWTVLLLAAYAQAEPLGKPATIEEFPGIVQVEVGLSGLFWTQQCAGSILTSYHVLSAASCFNGPLEYRRVRAGSDVRGTGGVVATLSGANNHPDFEFDGDITVILLDTAFILGPTMQQTPILGQGITLPIGLGVNLAGWGTTAEGGEISNSQLHSLTLYVTSNDDCALKYLDKKPITENSLCVGLTYLGGRDYDARDLGAPLFYQGTVVGIVSYGTSDAKDEKPVVATAIGSYTSWIIANAI